MTFYIPNDGAFCYDDLDDDLETDEVIEVMPAMGSRQLTVDEKNTPLFSSVEHSVTATVAGKFIAENLSDRPLTRTAIKKWVRQVIRTNYESLYQMGVDVDKEYLKWDGDLKDIDA